MSRQDQNEHPDDCPSVRKDGHPRVAVSRGNKVSYFVRNIPRLIRSDSCEVWVRVADHGSAVMASTILTASARLRRGVAIAVSLGTLSSRASLPGDRERDSHERTAAGASGSCVR